MLAWGVAAFSPGHKHHDNPYLTPGNSPFATSTPIWLQGGSGEVLIDTLHTFVNGMREIKGNCVELYLVPYAPQNIMFTGHILGWRPQAEEAAEVAGRFLQSAGVGAADTGCKA